MPQASSSLPTGSVTATPTAYLDFCRRAPGDCGIDARSAPAAIEDAEARNRAATRQAWLVAFDHSATQPIVATTTSPMDVSTAATAPSSRLAPAQGYDWTRAFAATRESARTPGALTATIRPAADKPQATPAAVEMTGALWATLGKVNTQVNRALVSTADTQTYGRQDYWTRPLAAGQKAGDCEDYVLEKLAALVSAGVPRSALSIAVVETRWGEPHAVLVVRSDQGDYVLDNLSPWILPWAEAGYRWRSVQTSADPFTWATVAEIAHPAQLIGGGN